MNAVEKSIKCSGNESEALGECPLVTFVVFAFNQEEYVREAVESAFSQTYSPLEIILSDDCSSDQTFEMMTEMMTEYDGPHKVILNRNIKNLGLGGHVNKIMEIVSGRLVVAGGGDDISLPIRVEELVSVWRSSGYACDSLHSRVITISADGKDIEERRTPNCMSSSPAAFINENIIIGASHAWTKRIFDKFGPLNNDVTFEDRAIGFRSSLCGGVCYIDIPLLKYRIGGISSDDQPNKMWRIHVSGVIQNCCDLLKLNSFSAKLYCSVLKRFNHAITQLVLSTCHSGAVELIKSGVWTNYMLFERLLRSFFVKK